MIDFTGNEVAGLPQFRELREAILHKCASLVASLELKRLNVVAVAVIVCKK